MIANSLWGVWLGKVKLGQGRFYFQHVHAKQLFLRKICRLTNVKLVALLLVLMKTLFSPFFEAGQLFETQFKFTSLAMQCGKLYLLSGRKSVPLNKWSE